MARTSDACAEDSVVDPATHQPYSCSMQSIELRFGDVTIPYHWGWDIEQEILHALRALDADRFLLVTDTTVAPLFGNDFARALERVARVSVLSIGIGEHVKSLATVSRLCEEAVACGATRRSCVLALGGGIVGNVGGALAGLLFRGIRLVHIPTTIVAAYDSVISLKQAVNSETGKNHFGLFLPATAIFVDLKLFGTLPEREFRSGCAELLKNSLAVVPEYGEQIARCARPEIRRTRAALEQMIPIAVEAKQRLMLHDKSERSTALALEYGHTIGHAIELVSTRRQRHHALSHGESIALGMLAAAHISCAAFGAPESLVNLNRAALQNADLPTVIDHSLDGSEILAAVSKDNKRGYLNCAPEVVAMVLLREPGMTMGSRELPLVPISLSTVEAAVRNIHASQMNDRPPS